MSIISRYILRALIGPFLFGSITVMFLFLLQFLMRYIDQLVGKGLGLWVIIQLIVLNLAWMVVLAIPMGVLVASLMAFGNLAGSNEITIIKSGGGSLLRMMRPVFIATTLLFMALFWFNDYILPDANHSAKVLMSDIQRKKPDFAIEKGQFSTQLEGYSILARDLDSATGTMLGVTIYENKSSTRRNVVSADSGVIANSRDYSKLIVSLYHGEIHQINQKDKADYRKVDFDSHQIVIEAGGFVFTESEEGVFSRGDREMRISDMQARVDTSLAKVTRLRRSIDEKISGHMRIISGDSLVNKPMTRNASLKEAQPIDRSKAAGRAQNRIRILRSSLETDIYQRNNQELNAKKFLVEIHKKYSIPAACLVFIFVGCPLGIITRRGNFGISAAITLGFYIVYWACLIGGEKLADRGIIEPWLGMWFANLIIGSTGIILTIKVSNESFSWRGISRGLKRLLRKG